MPSGKFHDAITCVLTIPIFAVSSLVSPNLLASTVVTAAFLFGGLMFGPDLDTLSRPYTRWGPVRPIWLPYRHFFPHRSRFSHGLLFGALFRVIYFLGVATLIFLIGITLYRMASTGGVPGYAEIRNFWSPIGIALRSHLGNEILVIVFIGLWAGAASHTFTDMAGSFIKTGRSGKFF